METLQLETKGSVAWVWLNRRRQLNAINETTLAELRGAFEALEQTRSERHRPGCPRPGLLRWL